MQKLGLNAKWLDLMAGGLVKKFGFAVGSELSLIDYEQQKINDFCRVYQLLEKCLLGSLWLKMQPTVVMVDCFTVFVMTKQFMFSHF